MKTLLAALALAAAAHAQTGTITPAVFAGAGLNDATSGGTYSGIDAPHSYVIEICTAGSPNTAKVTRDGGTASACAAITGAAQAIGDGVTLTFAATTGHTVGDRWTVVYAASGSVAASNYYQSGGLAVSRTAEDKLRESITSADFNPAGNGTTNDQANLQAAVDATPDGGALLLMPGTYAVCSLHVQRKKFAMFAYVGSGTMITRHSSCLNATGTGGPLFRADYSAAITLRDINFDQKGDNVGSGFSNSASTIYCWYCTTVRIEHINVTRAQANAIAIFASTDVQITNSTVSKYWWNGIVVSGDASDLTAIGPAERVVLNGNTADDGDYCFLVTVYAHDVGMNNNVCTHGSMAVVQQVDHLTVTGNVVHGQHTHGLVENSECMFMEAPTQFIIAGNFVSNCANNGIDVVGSQLGPDIHGTTAQMPAIDGLIASNELEDIGAACIQIIAQSYDHTVPGGNIKTQGNHCIRATTGYVFGGMNKGESEGDTAEEILTNGYSISVATNIVIHGCKIRNVSKLSSNSYFGIEVTGTASKDIDISDCTIIDQLGNMRFGIKDTTLLGGNPSQLRHHGNVIRGGATNIPMAPDPVTVPTVGTFVYGDMLENFPTATSDVLGWICTKTGTPTGTCSTGTWKALGYLDPDGRYAPQSNATITGVSAAAITIQQHTSGDQDYIRFKDNLTSYGRLYHPTATNEMRLDGYDTIRLKSNVLGGSGGKIQLDGNVNITGTCTGCATTGVNKTDTFVTSCSLTPTTATVCTNSTCSTTASVVASVSISCPTGTAVFSNGVHQ